MADPKSAEEAGNRRYPSRPIVGVAGAVVHKGKVLLIRRGQAPMQGAWTLPGGALETGETILEGVVREVLEETGLKVRPLTLLAMLDRIVRDEAGAVEYHYVLLDWMCELLDATDGVVAHAGSDAMDVAWTTAEDVRERGLDEATQSVVLDAIGQMEARA